MCFLFQAKYLSRNIQAKTVEAVRLFDEMLVQLGVGDTFPSPD